MLKFLADAVAYGDIDPALIGGAAAGGLLAVLMGMFVFVLIIGALIWIYMSLAFSGIAKKNNQSSPGLAWIPLIGPAIVASKAAQMHWWPMLLLIGFWIPFVGWIFSLAFTVFFVIWMWKILLNHVKTHMGLNTITLKLII